MARVRLVDKRVCHSQRTNTHPVLQVFCEEFCAVRLNRGGHYEGVIPRKSVRLVEFHCY